MWYTGDVRAHRDLESESSTGTQTMQRSSTTSTYARRKQSQALLAALRDTLIRTKASYMFQIQASLFPSCESWISRGSWGSSGQQVLTQVWLFKTVTCLWSSFCCRVDVQGIISTKMVRQLWWQLARKSQINWWRHCCKLVPAWTRVIPMHGASHIFPFSRERLSEGFF